MAAWFALKMLVISHVHAATEPAAAHMPHFAGVNKDARCIRTGRVAEKSNCNVPRMPSGCQTSAYACKHDYNAFLLDWSTQHTSLLK